MLTAHHALDQGREVFAVPGNVEDPLARGCHQLLKEGAHLVETAEDVVEGLGLMRTARTLGWWRTTEDGEPELDIGRVRRLRRMPAPE